VAALPQDTRAEVAFVGRSNAGKSSAINTLTGRKRLAHVSRTPGRTRQINLFSLDQGAALADLPGYGYAKVPGLVREQWNGLVADYLANRRQLVGWVLVMDARHPLTALDEQLLDWITPTAKPVHVLLTKADKLSKAEAIRTLALTRRAMQTRQSGVTAQLFSSHRQEGVEEAVAAIASWLFVQPANRSE
jgi:GTP-binding protein